MSIQLETLPKTVDSVKDLIVTVERVLISTIPNHLINIGLTLPVTSS